MTVRGSWKLKEEALDRTVWKIGFGRDYVRARICRKADYSSHS